MKLWLLVILFAKISILTLSVTAADHKGKMDIFNEIRERATKYSDIEVVEGTRFIEISPKSTDGFPVSYEESNEKSIVRFKGWHEEFDDKEAALNAFAFGLSEECRLKVYSKCGFEYRWILEYLEKGIWIEDSKTGLLLYPFWCKKKISIFQNHLIKKEKNQ